jgi:Pyruvate/2-oxoacid:ferredoxin oxidoreductase gamma subunit
MRRLCWAGLVLILMAGCKPEVPKDILQPEIMVPVLYDMHIADGYISAIPVPDSARRVGASYYKAIYQKYGIDSVRYTRSMNYYYDHVDVLSEIYKDVTADLKKSKDSIDKIQAKILKKEEAAKKLKKDSADKANPKLAIARADSLKKVKKDSIDRVKLENKAKVVALGKAKKDSAEKARPQSVNKADAPKKVI